MGDGPEAKKSRSVINHDGVKRKKTYRPKKKKFIQVGQRGFFATCNFQERDCVRECYNLLNRYADEMYGPEDNDPEKQLESSDSPDTDEEQDIASNLEKEVAQTSKPKPTKEARDEEMKKIKRIKKRFTYLNSGANNCIFIRAIAPVEPTDLGVNIVKNIMAKGRQVTRSLLRLIPMEIVCHAELSEIVDKAGVLFDKHFLKDGCTFSVVYNKRFNNTIKRDEIIRELAELVQSKNPGNKVNLNNPDKTVVVEIIKGLALITVLPDYFKYKKFNLIEMTNIQPPPPPAPEPIRVALGTNNGRDPNKSAGEGNDNDDNENRATIPLNN